MRTMQVQVYQFSELSDSAKEKAREWYREGESQDFGSFGELYEPAETAAALLGITFAQNTVKLHGGKTRQEPNIMWSGFSSQGDGACFTGSYEFVPGCWETIRNEFPKDTVLHGIADKLAAMNGALRLLQGGKLAGTITQSGNYCHKYTMDATATNSVDGEELEAETSEQFLGVMRDFADWIYKGLEAEYDWRMSDEAVDENIEANEYEFDEDGGPA